MQRSRESKAFGLLVAGTWVAAGFLGCSATSRPRGTGEATGGSDAGSVVPDTDADAGSEAEACSPTSCAAQNVSCGLAGDGCGGTLQCGTCTLPQTCGGDPQRPGQCGCTKSLCAQVPICPVASTTTLTGTVYDPAGQNPLYDALVYIPNDPSDPGLQPFPAGIGCDVCGGAAAGDPLVSTHTDSDGTFTLRNVPVGDAIPLVVQLGRWRRQLTVVIGSACGANAAPGKLTMPKTQLEGDIPRIAILTGGQDPVECILRKMGVADSEFTNPDGGGRIHLYTALDSGPHIPMTQGHGTFIDAQTPSQAALFAMNGAAAVLNQYDMVILECEGYAQSQSASDLAGLLAYTGAGGRVLASDLASTWLQGNGSLDGAAMWTGMSGAAVTANPVVIDVDSNPKGVAFDRWLEIAGLSTPGSNAITSGIGPAFDDASAVVAPTQRWLHYRSQIPLYFTFNTPVGAPAASQCGRVAFGAWHAQPADQTHWPNVSAFPTECGATPLTPAQAMLEFMLFDLSACVAPLAPLCTPTTCAEQGFGCGPASDGCGGLLDCGTCAAGRVCGGDGPFQCGSSSGCAPETCASQDIACGPAGDGCGQAIDCGNCPPAEICGMSGPGKCGKLQ
jgi:hypothetical protein